MAERSILNQTNETYDADLWADYDALYAGGKKFNARLSRFLVQNPQEPDDVYSTRKRESHYRCYMGGIVDYFAAYLFTSSMTVRARAAEDVAAETGSTTPKEVKPDAFYSRFKEDCDRKDSDIHLFLRGRATEAMIKRRAWWLVEMPPLAPTIESKADWEKTGAGNGWVTPLDAEQILDWGCDEAGQLEWAIVYSCAITRPSPMEKRDNVVETWKIYDRVNVSTYELRYKKNAPPAKEIDVPRIGEPTPHRFASVPLVCLDLDEGLWIGNRVASPQLEHFRLSNALTWSIRRTCYAMPVFKIDDPENNPVRMGAGYYLQIGPKDEAGWIAPPAGPYAEIREEVKSQKDEIFRIIHQMAMGVENNAAAVGRSGQSKMADQEVVQVILAALGDVVREAAERTYALLSEGRGEKYDWAIEGLDSFEHTDIARLVEAIELALTMDIPSPTFVRETKKRVALALNPDATQDTKDKIAKEIETNVTDESVLNPEPDAAAALALLAGQGAGGARALPGAGGNRPPVKVGPNGAPGKAPQA